MKSFVIAALIALSGCATSAAAPAVEAPSVRECKVIGDEFVAKAENGGYLLESPIQDEYSSGAVMLDPTRNVKVLVAIGLAPYLAQAGQTLVAGGAVLVKFEPCTVEGVPAPLAFLHAEVKFKPEEAQF